MRAPSNGGHLLEAGPYTATAGQHDKRKRPSYVWLEQETFVESRSCSIFLSEHVLIRKTPSHSRVNPRAQAFCGTCSWPSGDRLLTSRQFALLAGALLLGFRFLPGFEILASRLVDHLHRESHLAALVEPEQLYLDPVAFLHDIGDLLDPPRRKLADVHQSIAGAEKVHEGPEVHDLDYSAVVDMADLGLGRDRFDPVDRRLHGVAVGGGDFHRAIIGDVDLSSRLLDNLANDLAARADYLANLVDRDIEHLDPRRMLAQLRAMLGQRLGHLSQNVHAAFPRLAERDMHDLLGDAGDLDVHLQ